MSGQHLTGLWEGLNDINVGNHLAVVMLNSGVSYSGNGASGDQFGEVANISEQRAMLGEAQGLKLRGISISVKGVRRQ